MVLSITVKTLDSQNFQFEAEDDWTVRRFKEHIQPTVTVPSDEQRLIFCGRVLKDDKKLAEYDCRGKVIHLVRRPPPRLDGEGSGAADSDNNNNSSRSNENVRFLDESNVLFSAMTLGPDANMNHILRHILTLQQAIYTQTLGQGISVDYAANIQPISMNDTLTDIDRHLHNAARLLRITTNTINECMARIAALPPAGPRSDTQRDSSGGMQSDSFPGSVTDRQDDDEMRANSTGSPQNALDDMNIESTSQSAPRMHLPRQSLTTDDLPPRVQSSQGSMSGSMLRLGNSGRMTARQREESELNRYLTIFNYLCDIQNQFQGLARRYRQLIDISHHGSLNLSQDQSRTNESESSTSQGQDQTRSANMLSTFQHESRILGYYIPKIMHHISHLQHALSNFAINFTNGRLMLCGSAGRRSVRTQIASTSSDGGNRSSNQSDITSSSSNQPNVPDSTLEGSITITATTVDATPLVTTDPGSPGASATITVSSDSGQTMQIPVYIPLIPRGSLSMNLASGAPPTSTESSARADQTTESAQADQPQATPRQTTSSNSTQTATRPVGVISGRIPIPFDYYLSCHSPWVNNVTNRRARRGIAVSEPRIQIRTSRIQEAPTNSSNSSSESRANGSAGSTPNQGVTNPPTPGAALTEVVSNIVSSIFRQPSAMQSGVPNANSQQDPLLNIIPELALNAASQIIGGVFGLSTNNQHAGNQNPSNPPDRDQTEQNRQPSTLSSSAVMMDIDIDEGPSSHSRPIEDRSIPTPRPSSSRTSSDIDRDQLVQALHNHLDWIPIIESDILVMEQNQFTNTNNQPVFSDAYLSSIPRKKRRILAANPERVLILQPSPSEAIANLLRRAFSSSNLSETDSMDQILGSISRDSEVQCAYEDYIKMAVESRLKSDNDFCPLKFENSSKYFK